MEDEALNAPALKYSSLLTGIKRSSRRRRWNFSELSKLLKMLEWRTQTGQEYEHAEEVVEWSLLALSR